MNRRNFIYNVGMTGMSLPCLNAASAAGQASKAKSVINIFLSGGLSQYDSFNMEVDKAVIANSKIISSNADGVRVSHYFPTLARQMDKLLVINSMKSNQGAHPAGIYKMMTSYDPRSSITHPQRGVPGVQPRYALGRPHFVVSASIWRERLFKIDRRGVTCGAGEPGAGRVLPAHDAAAGGRAQRVGCVRIGKQHATLRQPCDVRRLIKAGRAVQRRVTPAKIIGEDKHDIHLLFGVFTGWQVGGCGIDACCRKKNEEEEVFHRQITCLWH
jgi:hypothetical protein